MAKKIKKIVKKIISKKKEIKKNTEKKISNVNAGQQMKSKKNGRLPTLLRGMKDILPKDESIWKKMYHEAENIADSYGFGRIETPSLEEASLFIRSIGKGTDVVEKEMYTFEDKDLTKVALRPEATASIVRAYFDHGMQAWPKPIKLWYWSAMFRHDRPQSGRFREFHQFGCETLGVREPAVDAELVVVAYNFLRDLGISTQVRINSIGNLDDRSRYTAELVSYLRTKRNFLCEDCLHRITKNPLRILDCKAEQCQTVIEEAPQIVDWLGEDSKKFFMSVLEYLDEMTIPYVLDSKLVRGLDYYTDTVFELFEEKTPTKAEEPVVENRQVALGGGGRYDELIGTLGGQPTPACGFALGLERVNSAMRRKEQEETTVPVSNPVKIFFAHLGEQPCRRALFLIEELRRMGITVRHNLGRPALKVQLEQADKMGASHTLILGQKETQDGTLIVRDMESGIQEIIDQKKLEQHVKRLLSRNVQ